MTQTDQHLPDILVIGAMKCATSSICEVLERHPDVYFLPRSEPNFFSADANWERGLEHYRSLFAEAGAAVKIGEGSNSYSNAVLYPETARRIFETLPQARLIYSVRHPLERIVSAWAQIRYQAPDKISADLNRAVREQSDRLVGESLYWRTLSAYLDVFPKEQLWLGFLEDLKLGEEPFYRSLCSFCGVAWDPSVIESDSWKNKSEGRSMLGAEYNAVKKLPGVSKLRGLIPASLKKAVKKGMEKKTPSTRELVAQLDLPDDMRRALKEDAQAFLRFAGKAPDFWAL